MNESRPTSEPESLAMGITSPQTSGSNSGTGLPSDPGGISAPLGASGMSRVVGVSGVSGVAGVSGLSGSQQADAGVSRRGGEGRDSFAAEELAIVLSHFEIGTIEAIKEFPRGSRRAPKLLIRAQSGAYLLKRRAKGRDDPFKVAFCHAIQLYLASKQFPLPHLIGTRGDNNSMLQWRGGIYELFEYIKGSGYDNSLEATQDAGRTLALFHKLLIGYQPEYEPPQGSYHGSRAVAASMDAIPGSLAKRDPSITERTDEIQKTVKFLHACYNEAALRANELGLSDWPMHIVHGDWHPGNMLFRGSKVVGVIDYDSARMQQRVLDIANGALQLSILGGGDDPSAWPDYVDISRFKRFLRGYESVPDCVLSRAELRVIPNLMIEALIAESVIPVAATGSFARIEGLGFLRMVERKVCWLREQSEHLVKIMEG